AQRQFRLGPDRPAASAATRRSENRNYDAAAPHTPHTAALAPPVAPIWANAAAWCATCIQHNENALTAVRLEIDVDLHSDRKRIRLRQIDQHLDHVDVGHVALPPRIVDACWFDDRRDEGDLSRKLASTKGIGPDDGRLTDLDLAEIALIKFRAHPPRGKVADDQPQLRVAGEFPRLAIYLQHRPGDGRADRQSFDCRRRGRRFSACNVDLALGKGRQWR